MWVWRSLRSVVGFVYLDWSLKVTNTLVREQNGMQMQVYVHTDEAFATNEKGLTHDALSIYSIQISLFTCRFHTLLFMHVELPGSIGGFRGQEGLLKLAKH